MSLYDYSAPEDLAWAVRTFDPRVSRMTLERGRSWKVYDPKPRHRPKAVSKIGTEAIKRWLSEAIEADRAGRHATAIDIIYDNIDRLLAEPEPKLAEIDSVFRNPEIYGLSLTFQMSILSITLPASDYLPSRHSFFAHVWETCVSSGRDAERLLGGLKQRSWRNEPSALDRAQISG